MRWIAALNRPKTSTISSIRFNTTFNWSHHSIGEVAVRVDLRRDGEAHETSHAGTVQRIVNAWSIDPFGRLIDRARQALIAAECEARPGKWKLEHRGMGTAGGALVKQYDIPTIGYGPGSEHLAHSPNEYVEISKIHEAVFGTTTIVQDLIGFPVFRLVF